jgi:predicted PurR-regulated permease PerM
MPEIDTQAARPENLSPQPSPRWGPMTKTVVGLTVIAIIGALIIWFRGIIGPLILAFVLAYLLFPLVKWVSDRIRISWRTSVTIIYFLFVILVGGVLFLVGLAVLQQIQSLLIFVQRFITDLPVLVANLSTQNYVIGPFIVNFGELFDLQYFTNQVLATIQPILGQIGSLVTSFAGSAFVTVAWGLFVLIISYFLVAEAGRLQGQFFRIEIPGYEDDILRMGAELRKTWNAFLRGQLIISVLVLFSYAILMNILGVGFAFGIAILAALARFVPYIGPLITFVVAGLVAFFQVYNYFGLAPWQYTLLVVLSAILLDQAFDNIIAPRFLGQKLNIHPAAILVAAIVFANLIGIIGLILAAPVVATLNVISRYVFRKMLDQNPWPEESVQPRSEGRSWAEIVQGYSSSIRKFFLRQNR